MYIYLKFVINVCGFLKKPYQILCFRCHIRAQSPEINKKLILLPQKHNVSMLSGVFIKCDAAMGEEQSQRLSESNINDTHLIQYKPEE